MSKYVPYVPDLEAWKNHFTKSTTRHKSFHPLESIKQTTIGELKTDAIKLVIPTAQQVQQAEAELKRSRASPRQMKGGTTKGKGIKKKRGRIGKLDLRRYRR